MLRSYNDIRSKLGEPLWWDEHGAPRYDEFTPRMLGVYDDIAVLYRIRCQDCPQEFLVASCESTIDRMKLFWMFRDRDKDELLKPDLADFCEGLHYGDPPRHDCQGGAGETMNCYDLEILEAWERYSNHMEWTRHSELEGPMEGSDEEIDGEDSP